MNKNLLLVEDDAEIISLLKEGLRYEGFELTISRDGDSGLEKARQGDYGLILMDWMLPEMAGIDVVRALHEDNIHTPVIMLTARHDELDKVAALEAGCDDYITKPFSIKELVARINAVMRRAASHIQDDEGQTRSISKGDLEIDLEKRSVIIRGTEIQLTATEFNLLTLLIRQPGRVYSRKQLLDIVWDYSFEGYENTVNTHVNRLRSKIEKNPNKPEYVLTVWGVGYKFSDETGD
ncbi:MAG: response regulator transcription factor [Candidatus Marinimicrobia bacterium]|nr:response regulator transcription factor [Candidatus Neomarinimicrobiota bacterium]